jgi:hypothetical protein
MKGWDRAVGERFSTGVNPCDTVYALARYIAHKMVDEINA